MADGGTLGGQGWWLGRANRTVGKLRRQVPASLLAGGAPGSCFWRLVLGVMIGWGGHKRESQTIWTGASDG